MSEDQPVQQYGDDPADLTLVPEPAPENPHPTDLIDWLERHVHPSMVLKKAHQKDLVGELVVKRSRNPEIFRTMELLYNLITGNTGTNRQRSSITRICRTLEGLQSSAPAPECPRASNSQLTSAFRRIHPDFGMPFRTHAGITAVQPYTGDLPNGSEESS